MIRHTLQTVDNAHAAPLHCRNSGEHGIKITPLPRLQRRDAALVHLDMRWFDVAVTGELAEAALPLAVVVPLPQAALGV